MPNTICLATPTSLYYIMMRQYNSLAISPPCYINIIIYRGSTTPQGDLFVAEIPAG